MDLRIAKAIMQDYGKFLELSHGALMGMFLTKIPESLLPYSKAKIEEALSTAIGYFNSMGEKKVVQQIERCLFFLMFYVDDEQAIKSATESATGRPLGDEKFFKKLLQSRIERQEKLFNELVERVKNPI